MFGDVARAAVSPDSSRVRHPFSWTVDASLDIAVSPKLVNDLYDPGFGLGGGIERELSRSMAVTARLGYVGLPFNSGDNPFDQGQAIEAEQGQLNCFDLTVGARLGPPPFHVRLAAGGSVATGKSIALLTSDGAGGFLVREYDPGGSGLALRAGLGSTFGSRQRYELQVGWSMTQAQDRIQSVVISAGALIP